MEAMTVFPLSKSYISRSLAKWLQHRITKARWAKWPQHRIANARWPWDHNAPRGEKGGSRNSPKT
jgi:hypothetical protein